MFVLRHSAAFGVSDRSVPLVVVGDTEFRSALSQEREFTDFRLPGEVLDLDIEHVRGAGVAIETGHSPRPSSHAGITIANTPKPKNSTRNGHGRP